MVEKEVERDENQKSGGCLNSAATAVFTGLESFYKRIGFAVGTRPWAFMLAALVLLLACIAGFMRFEQEAASEELWIPSGTTAQKDKSSVEKMNYVKFARFEEFIILSNPPGDNVLTPDVLDYIYEIHQKVITLQVENPLANEDGAKKNVSYAVENSDTESMCYRRGVPCLQKNIIEVFGSYPEAWRTKKKLLSKLNSGELVGGGGEPVDILTLLGGLERNEDGDVISAQAIATNYFINNNEKESKTGGYVDEKGDAWEKLFLELLEEESKAAEAKGLKVDRVSVRSFADEFGSNIGGDIARLNVAIILLMAYTVTMLSKWSEGCVGSRLMLTVGGFISIGLAIGAALGLGSAFGLFYTPLMGVFPFLLIGIGVDDMFVMVSAYDRTPTHLPVPERLSLALGRSGPSITVTSLTDFCAFLIGSNTSLPGLKAFSIYTAIGILLTLVFQVLFFAGWLVCDEKLRRNNGRIDVLCCFKAPQVCKSGCCNGSLLEKLLRKLASALSSTWSKTCVLIIFGLIAAGGIYGLSKIEVDSDIDDFIPQDSYLGDWNAVRETLFKSIGAGTDIYMQNVDFASAKIQKQLTSMYKEFKNNPHIASSTVQSWYEEFKASEGGGIIPSEQFYSKLSAWLQKSPMSGGGSNFVRDIIMSKNGDGITTCRFTGNHLQSQKSKLLVRQMNSLRSTVSTFPAPLGPNSFAYGPGYIQNEQYKAIGKEALTNIGLALLMVLIVVAVLLVNPLGAGLTFLSIALGVIELVGYMHWWGVSIDNVVVIFTVIALGLSVDYSVHIAHAFLTSSGTPDERMSKALTEVGPPVLHGALSTFMVVLVLSLSISYVFVIFFRALFLCVVLGLAHGMILLPVTLSLVAPSTTLNPASDIPVSDVELTKGDNEAKPQP